MAICPHLLQDQLVWVGTPTGEFSVKSSYHLDVRRRSSSVPSTSFFGTPSPIWSTIWSLQVPKHVQSFLWHACRDLLPTRDKLLRRKIVQDPFCPMCGKEAEPRDTYFSGVIRPELFGQRVYSITPYY
jgi:hypothetical protein